MIWLLLFCSSIWLGYELIPFFKTRDLSFFIRLFSGWLLGVQITSIALYVCTAIIPLNAFLVIVVASAEIAVSFIAMRKSKKFPFSFDKSPWFMVLILFTCGSSLKYLAAIYGKAPQSIPFAMTATMDREISFISSVLYGCNRRRSNILFFAEPLIKDKHFYGYSLPLLFTAGLMAGGLSYGSASIIICFMNTVATSFAIFNFAKKYTKWPVLASFLFLFSGSWAGYLYFKAANRLNPENDLVHQLSKNHITCWYHPFAHLLSLSKSTSFSVAFAQYSIFWQSSPLSPFFAACCPSLATSIAVFGTLVGMPCDMKTLCKCALTLLLRLYPFTFTYKPLFREAEMRGTFFAPIVIWYQALGPVFVVIALFFWLLPRGTFKFYFIASVGPFLILNFFREGNDHLQNACAIASTTFPLAIVAFTELMRKFINWPQDEENKGIAAFFMSATVAFLLFGGYITSKRIEGHQINVYTKHDIEASEWIKGLPRDAVIYTDSKVLSPVALSGRQQFIGSKAELFSYGVDLKKRLDEIIELDQDSNITKWKEAGITHVLKDETSGFKVPIETETIKKNYKYSLGKL
jgi:hypothetical protein